MCPDSMHLLDINTAFCPLQSNLHLTPFRIHPWSRYCDRAGIGAAMAIVQALYTYIIWPISLSSTGGPGEAFIFDVDAFDELCEKNI